MHRHILVGLLFATTIWARKYVSKSGTSAIGDTIKYIASGSIATCTAECDRTKGCIAFVLRDEDYAEKSEGCWLKKGPGKSVKQWGRVYYYLADPTEAAEADEDDDDVKKPGGKKAAAKSAASRIDQPDVDPHGVEVSNDNDASDAKMDDGTPSQDATDELKEPSTTPKVSTPNASDTTLAKKEASNDTIPADILSEKDVMEVKSIGGESKSNTDAASIKDIPALVDEAKDKLPSTTEWRDPAIGDISKSNDKPPVTVTVVETTSVTVAAPSPTDAVDPDMGRLGTLLPSANGSDASGVRMASSVSDAPAVVPLSTPSAVTPEMPSPSVSATPASMSPPTFATPVPAIVPMVSSTTELPRVATSILPSPMPTTTERPNLYGMNSADSAFQFSVFMAVAIGAISFTLYL